MQVKYTGLSDTRTVRADVFSDMGLIEEPLDNDLVWTPGSVVEVDDQIGEWLIEHDREFKNPQATTRDLRSHEELLEVAQTLQIRGRTKMDVETLRSAVQTAELETSSEGDESTPDDSTDNQGTPPGEPEES